MELQVVQLKDGTIVREWFPGSFYPTYCPVCGCFMFMDQDSIMQDVDGSAIADWLRATGRGNQGSREIFEDTSMWFSFFDLFCPKCLTTISEVSARMKPTATGN